MHVAYDYEDCIGTWSDGRHMEKRVEVYHFGDVTSIPSAFETEPDDAAGRARARASAAAARLSAGRAAIAAAHTCHQLFGAIGITLEGPVFHVSRRIRQLVSQQPDIRQYGMAEQIILWRVGDDEEVI